tara:strand:- start:747 stop:1058 length:312 start_codon:yes stop_codon:yes gene_type:complete
MLSIFDNEDDLLFRRSRYRPTMPMPSISAAPQLYAPTQQTVMRKRTVSEALRRLPAPPTLTGVPYGLQRILRKPLMIYTAAYFLAGATIIVDPLDRLEGGLID